jgi:hypothetical protein
MVAILSAVPSREKFAEASIHKITGVLLNNLTMEVSILDVVVVLLSGGSDVPSFLLHDNTNNGKNNK